MNIENCLSSRICFPTITTDNVCYSPFINIPDVPEFKTDPIDTIRLIFGRQFINAKRIYNNIRIVKNNGIPLLVSQDYQNDRINVELQNNIIVCIAGIY